MSGNSPPRRPLHERSDSHSNTVRLVPATPPRLLIDRDDIYSRTPLPTHPAHILSPGGQKKGKGRDDTNALPFEFQRTTSAHDSTGSSGSTSHTTHEPPQSGQYATGSPISKPKPIPKKRILHIHKDGQTNKTFSLVDHPPSAQDTPTSPTLSTKSSFSLLSSNAHNAGVRSNSLTSCTSDASSIIPTIPTTPAPDVKQSIVADPIDKTDSPWNYQFVGGLRKVAKTPDLKQKTVRLDSPLPPLPESEDTAPGPSITSQDLSTKQSFQSQSTDTATTASDNTNYKVYHSYSAPDSDTALSPASPESNYQILAESSPASSVIHRPQESSSESENENYEVYPSPSASFVDLGPQPKYSHESLVVAPLKPRARRSNESFGYYKSRSRESLRTGSLTSISTVLTQQEAARAIIGSGSLVQLPVLASKLKGTSSWASPLSSHPLRFLGMNETPHQWSSQLSTVPSVSEGGTDRGSRSWSDDLGRRSSIFHSSASRHSQQMLSISSSMTPEEAARSRSESLEPPQPSYARNGQRYTSGSSIIEDHDEYGDGLAELRDMRHMPSRTRLSGYYSVSSENERTNTMRSTTSSRANSLLSNTIPAWAKLYYGSGERRFLGVGAPGSSTEGSDSRTHSFRSGSPNTDNFPLSIYSPRRRPREVNTHGRRSNRGSMEITPAPQLGSDGQLIQDPYTRRFRTWSMSSIWSPHLQFDRRANRHSVWGPPSVNWSTEGAFGRRNVQVVMFIVGWIFPFAWMIAAFLPLPRNPVGEMRERDYSTSNLDESNECANDYTRQFGPMDEARYESARWWRNLNRWMSIVGLLIIAAIVVLVVSGIKEGW